jgi:hypothetical protein
MENGHCGYPRGRFFMSVSTVCQAGLSFVARLPGFPEFEQIF